MRYSRLAAVCLSALLLMPGALRAEGAPAMVFFGDSLSDTGNRFLDEGSMNTPPYDLALAENLVPSIPYAIGGPTFTNGSVWAAQFAERLGSPGAAQAALRSDGISANYAYAGARASNAPPLAPNGNRNLTDQVVQYLADVNHQVAPDALHVLFIGGNDVAEAVGAYLQLIQQAPAQAQPVLEAIVSNAAAATFANALALRQAGAVRFLVVLAPNVGHSPLFAEARPFSQLVGAAAASGYNCALAGNGVTRVCPPSAIPTLQQMLEASGAEVHILDGQAVFDDIIANPAQHGLENTTDHCILPNEPPYQCGAADRFVYWDNIHPTAKVHGLIADAAVVMLE